MDFRAELLFKPDFRIVITIVEHVCDHVTKRILQLTTSIAGISCERLIFSMTITTWRPSKFQYSKSNQNLSVRYRMYK